MEANEMISLTSLQGNEIMLPREEKNMKFYRVYHSVEGKLHDEILIRYTF